MHYLSRQMDAGDRYEKTKTRRQVSETLPGEQEHRETRRLSARGPITKIGFADRQTKTQEGHKQADA